MSCACGLGEVILGTVLCMSRGFGVLDVRQIREEEYTEGRRGGRKMDGETVRESRVFKGELRLIC